MIAAMTADIPCPNDLCLQGKVPGKEGIKSCVFYSYWTEPAVPSDPMRRKRVLEDDALSHQWLKVFHEENQKDHNNLF